MTLQFEPDWFKTQIEREAMDFPDDGVRIDVDDFRDLLALFYYAARKVQEDNKAGKDTKDADDAIEAFIDLFNL